MRGRALAIVERAYRGAVEQQYAHVLWLVQALSAQVEMGLLLRGPAALYALAGQPQVTLSLAGRPLRSLPDYEAALVDLVSRGAGVYVSAGCLARLGAAGRRLCEGVRPVDGPEIARLCASYDRVWYL